MRLPKSIVTECRRAKGECRWMVSRRSDPYIKKIAYLTSTFDIQYSLFDIRFFNSSFIDQTGRLDASGRAEPVNPACGVVARRAKPQAPSL
jgi:hypothetical protein